MATSRKPVLPILLLVAALCFESGCASKKYVKQRFDPLGARIDEVDELAKQNEKRIKEVDHNAQAGIQSVQKKENEVEKKVNRAAQDAEKAREIVQTVQNQTEKVERNLTKRLRNVDNYETVDRVDVFFKFDRTELTSEAKASLDQLAQKVKGGNGYLLEFQGFTDRTGSEEYNLALSQRRSDSVMRYLAEHHQIPLYRMFLLGFGEAEPPGNSRADRAANRKVEIRVLKSEGIAMARN
jgi:outer membrane protein OmpA-like peptidoglycan-associated protein